MATVHAKAFRVTETSRVILQSFIADPIPESTKFILASPEGYLFFDEEPALHTAEFGFRLPRLAVLSYYDIEYESE